MEMQTAAQSGVQRLYHYQDANLDYLRDTLTNRRVHLSNPKNFNDLWDCKPYFQFDVEYQESRRKWGLHLDSHHSRLGLQSQNKSHTRLRSFHRVPFFGNPELARPSALHLR